MLQNWLKSKELTFKNPIYFVLLQYNSSLVYILYQLSRKVIFPIETNRKFQIKLPNVLLDKIITQPLVLVFLSDLVIKGKDLKCDRFKLGSKTIENMLSLVFNSVVLNC